MSIFLSADGISIDLTDIAYLNEYSESPVVQSVEWSVDGSAVIEHATKLSGLSIVLAGSDQRAWLARSDADQVRTWRDIPGKPMTLSIRGQSRAVIFDHRSSAFEAKPIGDVSEAPADWPHAITLRFLTV